MRRADDWADLILSTYCMTLCLLVCNKQHAARSPGCKLQLRSRKSYPNDCNIHEWFCACCINSEVSRKPSASNACHLLHHLKAIEPQQMHLEGLLLRAHWHLASGIIAELRTYQCSIHKPLNAWQVPLYIRGPKHVTKPRNRTSHSAKYWALYFYVFHLGGAQNICWGTVKRFQSPYFNSSGTVLRITALQMGLQLVVCLE